MLALSLLGGYANAGTNSQNPVKLSGAKHISYSCSNEYVKAESIRILWSEANLNLPISVLDGFNSETCIGKVTKNTFTWDRGASQASMDRHTGVLTIKPKKDGVSISLNCTVVD
ncbi:hypothetical protein [Polynucleobacter sp. MWH-UH2A]|uniref:hypothetical protein n=1 Tax=Polynucleobacter sp. MWH-UH2A TaxID=1855617 RepID=UPI001BFE41F8|nr:hypothetical protein [Polynucleobacter sp. MWH-UH2A]QWD64682.1 hypothetical protein IC571_03355 [Polynucleobacter sp. MWH-UH2A]